MNCIDFSDVVLFVATLKVDFNTSIKYLVRKIHPPPVRRVTKLGLKRLVFGHPSIAEHFSSSHTILGNPHHSQRH